MNDNQRRPFPPGLAKAICRENAAIATGTVAFWALMGAVLGRVLRVW